MLLKMPAGEHALWTFFVLAGLTTAILGGLLAVGTPTVQSLYAYFWTLTPRSLSLPPLASLLLLAPVCLWLIVRRTDSRAHWISAATLVMFGYTLQVAFAMADEMGWNRFRVVALNSGHAEFIRNASHPERTITSTIVQYEQLLGDADRFAKSKPPGHLLAYQIAARVADALMPRIWDPEIPPMFAGVNRTQWRLTNFSALAMPLSAALAAIPLVWLGFALLGPEHGMWPAWLFLLAPPLSLVIMHLDQALYPLLATMLWWTAFRAGAGTTRATTRFWAATGLLAWLNVFVSFSLMPALFIAAGFVVAGRLHTRSPLWDSRLSIGAGVALSIFLGLHALLYFAGYDPIVRYHAAMANHQAWKDWSAESRWYAARLDLIELFYWLGSVLGGLFIWQIVRTAGVFRHKQATGHDVVVGITALALILTALLGKTVSEVARLWIFFIPAVALAAAGPVRESTGKRARFAMGVTALIQITWSVLLKRFQDFV